MGVDQVSKHDHSTDTEGGDEIRPSLVETDEQTVNNSFTDPAGVSHTGELADISDVGSVLNFVAAEDPVGTTQSLTSGNEATVEFSTELQDPISAFDLANNQYTPPTTDNYFVAIAAQFQDGTSGDSLKLTFKNTVTGTEEIITQQADTSRFETLSIANSVELQGGDAHEVRAANFQSSDTISFAHFTVVKI